MKGHAQHRQHDEFAQGAEHRHGHVEHHAGFDAPADAQVVIHRIHHAGHRGTDGIDPDILGRHLQQGAFRPHQAQQKRGGHIQERPHQHALRHHHQAGAGEDIVGLLGTFFAQTDRNGHRGAHADQVRDGKVDDDQRHGQVDGGERLAPQQLPHKNAVQQLIQRRCQHSDRTGQRRLNEQAGGAGIQKQGFLIHFPFPPYFCDFRAVDKTPDNVRALQPVPYPAYHFHLYK